MLDYETHSLKPKAIKKETLSASLKRPITVYPITLGILAGLYGLSVGFGSLVGLLIAGAMAVGAMGWAYEFFVKGDSHAMRFLNKYRAKLAAERERAIEQLKADIQQIDHPLALEQLRKISAKYNNFVDVLGRKLNKDELTYNRYLSMGEQVFLNALDNLERVVLSLQSVSTIDVNQLTRKIDRLQDDDPMRSTLMERKSLWDAQYNLAQHNLMENEKAMTKLDHVCARIASVQTQSKRAQMDMEDVMNELETLIKSASKYKRS